MMQTLRKKMKYVLGVALVAFLALIFFQWGANVTGGRDNQKTNIVEIDGVSIPYTRYYAFVQAKEQENKTVSRDEVWQLLIDEIMWSNLIRKEGIQISDEEIWEIIKTSPPPEIVQSEFMQNENGEFDYNKYLQLLQAPQSRQWLYAYEQNLKAQLPKEKLRSLFSTFGWVSPFEDSLAMTHLTTVYDVTYIHMPVFRSRALVSVSDEEAREYYNEHLEKFASKEMKVLAYVYFDRKPSVYDTLEARERIEDFVARVQEEGEDFMELAFEVSDDTSVVIEFEGPAGLKPYLMNVYNELKDGEVSDIVPAARGFEVIKRIGKGSIYKMKAEIVVSESTKGEIYDRVMSFKDAANELGFEQAAEEIELPVRKTYPMSTDNVSFPVRNTDGLAEFLEKARKGDIEGPFGSLGGYYVFTLDSIIPAVQPSFDEIIPRVRAELEREKFTTATEEMLAQVHANLQSGAKLEEIVSEDTLLLLRELKDASLAEIIRAHGGEFGGVLAALEPGGVSTPLVTEWAGFLIRCDNKNVIPFDSTMYMSLQMKRQSRLQYITTRAFTPKEINDYRDDFFE